MSPNLTRLTALLAASAALSGCVSERWSTYAWLSLNDDFGVGADVYRNTVTCSNTCPL